MRSEGESSLRRRVAIVTGASRGIGQSTAIALAAANYAIVLVQRGEAMETVAQLRKVGAEAYVHQVDLADPDQAANVVPLAVNVFGAVDVLIANAGTIERKPAVDITIESWSNLFALNVTSLFVLNQAMGRYCLSHARPGKIVNVASVLSMQGGFEVASYAASKGAVIQLTKALANEWAAAGINVNAVAPGYVANEITAPLRADPERVAAITSRIPAGRWATSDDVAAAITFLASNSADYVHGHVLAVDGGWMSR